MSNKAKQLARRKRLRKVVNQRRNRPRYNYQLDVDFPEKGWVTAKRFRTMDQVRVYVDEQEAIRRSNKTDIIEGVIRDMRSGREVARILPHKVGSDMPVSEKELAVAQTPMPGDGREI